jgi:septum formation protein
LLGKLGLAFEVRLKEIPEEYPPHLTREEVAEYLARHKASAYLEELAPEEMILTADTIVCLGDQVLNKPRDAAEARFMLRQLSGRVHDVITGVCLLTCQKSEVFHDLTRVYFKALTDAEISHYVSVYQPLDKAGAYGAQEWMGMIGVEKIEGSYFNVMGLPVHKLYEALQRF